VPLHFEDGTASTPEEGRSRLASCPEPSTTSTCGSTTSRPPRGSGGGEHSPDQHGTHDRLRPGINHLATTVGTRDELDRMRSESTEHGWHELYADRYPHAGGEDHVALYLESSEGFEVEVVAGE
jgi:hypothetical protein